MYYTQLTMIDGSVAHKKNILLGACMSQSDCIFGVWHQVVSPGEERAWATVNVHIVLDSLHLII